MDYLDPEEEYELMHAEEMEMMHEIEEDFEPPDTRYPAPKSKKSLDFSEGNTQNRLLDPTICGIDNNEARNNTERSDKCNDKENFAPPIISSTGIQPLDTHKRAVRDLFGDIDDIDFDSVRESKRARIDLSETEKQNLMIEKILQMRKQMYEIKMHSTLIESKRSQKKMENCMTRGVPKWPFMPVTDARGQRLYLRLHSEDYIESEVKKIAANTKKGGFLNVPYAKLRQLALEEMAKKNGGNEYKTKDNKKMNMEVVKEKEMECDLLVERYKPRSYLQLLSDEGTNRLLLQWLKLWDKLVFNREKKIKPKEKPQELNSKTKYPVLSQELDEHHRPQYKVALLCGPPGLGKTTLAHMIAKQAGYNVVEVNASDDRSPDLFRTQLEAATQMRAVMGASPRPNCLVLDEIDGAPLASIEVVVKFATDKNSGGKKSKNKKSSAGILRRPIICICNDVYVPALRPLRQIAFTLHFPPTSSARLGERLMEICNLEDVKSDLGAMIVLSEKTGNDIRACLQALHCLRSSRRVTLTQIKGTKLGVKDTQLGLFSAWQKVFHKSLKITPAKNDAEPEINFKSLIAPIIRAVQNCGEFDRLAQGVHENFPNLNFRDLGMTAVSRGLNWFCFFDVISSAIQVTQNYVLYPYLPYAFGAWHLLFSSRTWPKLSYPSVGYEMFQRQVKCNQQLDCTMHGMQPQVRACMQKNLLLLDSIPYILEVIVPNIRPVNTQLFTSKEKEELAHVVSIMIDYNLNYTQERTQDGSFVYNLDPNLEDIGRFKEVANIKRSVSYGGRQMLSKEVENERLRRAEAILYKNKGNEENKQNMVDNKNKGDPVKPVPNFMQKLTPKALKKKPQMEARDFFGRIVETSLSAVQEKAKMDDIVKSSVWFHFKEGYNNAVRRNVLMKDLY